MSGLLALAMFDHEIEYYSVAAHVLASSSLLYEDTLRAEQLKQLEVFAEWIKPLAAISCVIGPMARWLWEMNEDIFVIFGSNLNAKAADLHSVLLLNTEVGIALRRLMQIPDTMAKYLRQVTPSNSRRQDLYGISDGAQRGV